MSVSLEPHGLSEWARDLGKTNPFLDFHVHPFDVLTGDIIYRRNEQAEGVFSKGNAVYHTPVIERRLELQPARQDAVPDAGRAFLLAARLKYVHTGSKVITDQLDPIGFSGALLLPVVRETGGALEMLKAVGTMFSSDSRLMPGCAFPVGIPSEEVAAFFFYARENFGIHAIKIHPNLAGIDPLTCRGHDLIEATLVAAGALGLPVIVHGGFTSALSPSSEAEFGLLSHLETINWSLSSAPVIIAHAGCHELKGDDASVALSKLEILFSRHPNLMADTSSLDPLTLRLVLEKVSRDRLIFGSDAFYVQIWKAWLAFLKVLQEVSSTPDDDLIRIASINPANCLKTVSIS